MEDFASPEEIQPDEFVTFFVMANYQGDGKMPIPEGFRQVDGSLLIPGDELEPFVQQYFDVSTDTLRSGTMYQEVTESYLLSGLGNPTPSQVRVTELREDGDQTVIVFDNYMDFTETEQSDPGRGGSGEHPGAGGHPGGRGDPLPVPDHHLPGRYEPAAPVAAAKAAPKGGTSPRGAAFSLGQKGRPVRLGTGLLS